VTSEIELSIEELRLFVIALMTATIAVLNNEFVPISKELIFFRVCSENIIVTHIRKRILG
jgi:hypothetical protein